MSSHHPADASPGAADGSMQEDVGCHGERSVGEIREEFGNTVVKLKEKYGLLLEQRDRRIKDLATKLAQGPPEALKHRMLIVDNAESTAAIVSRYLEGYPVEVVHVAAAQAWDCLRSQEYDAIMVEAGCFIGPGVHGMTLWQQLCESGERKNIVVMSSRPGDRVKNCVVEAGAAFLRKPFRRAQLVELIRRTLLKEKR